MSRHGPLRRFFRQWRHRPGVMPWLMWQPQRFLLFVLGLLPERVVLGIVGGIGRLAWLSKRRRAVGREHIAAAFPDMSAADRDRILKRSCVSLGKMGAEAMLIAPRLHGGRLEARLEFDDGTEELLRGLVGKPAVFVQAHLGSFEIAAAVVTTVGIRPAFPMRMPNNWYLAQRLMDDRRGWPINLVQRQGAVRHLLRHLKDGGQLMLATDQSAHHNPLDVPWFGRPAPTERAAAAIALRTGAPMLVSWCYRPPAGGSWQFGARLIEPGGPPRPVDDAALVELLGRAHAVLEGAIRRRPEQYLWIHDRYRTRT